MNTQVIEVQTDVHKGQEIRLYRIHDTLHGTFWGWIVGEHIELPTFRHKGICFDCARTHIDGIQR